MAFSLKRNQKTSQWLKNLRIRSFKGGIRLPGFKQQSTALPIGDGPLPPMLYLPLNQHKGSPAVPEVKVGDYVHKGQLIAQAGGYLSASVHASSSGEVIAIEPHTIAHASGLQDQCIVVKTDGLDRWPTSNKQLTNPYTLPRQDLIESIQQAGIVGLGGAAFPYGAKLQGENMELLIVNGVECEPFITCDDMLMQSFADEIVDGAALLAYILKCQYCVIAVEDNKPQATRALSQAIKRRETEHSVELITVPTLFPAGGEKQLIKSITGREVPRGKIPRDIGMVVMNVGTVKAIHDAVAMHRPLISRIVTVTGDAVPQPKNYQVLLGTPMNELLLHAGCQWDDGMDLIMGGPMMGIRLQDASAPVVKATNCLIASPAQGSAANKTMPCIRCGQCAQVCPMHLLPQQLYWHAKAKQLDQAKSYHLMDCIECGCCAQVCPSSIPLVDYYRFAKSELRHEQEKRRKADLARQRNVQHQQRLEAEAREKAAKKQRRKSRRNSEASQPTAESEKQPC